MQILGLLGIYKNWESTYILFLLTHFFLSAQAVVKKLEIWNAFIVSSKALFTR